jgi:hypothetical protein
MNVPTLKYFYSDRWWGDNIPADPDGSAESSNELEGGLDSENDTDEEEGGDINTEEWYVRWLIKV